jgi:exopolysaccharide production protein ExoQ
MPPLLAFFLWFVLLVVLLRYDPAKETKTLLALWVPVIWMFILGSRLPSQWLGMSGGSTAEAYQEGNPLDRTISLILIALAVWILSKRSFRWSDFFIRNWVLTVFLSYALLSVCWSDFPFVAFKRWFRDFGNYLVLLVALSDPHPLEAIRTLLRRLCYLLIPLCVLLIKYYPELAKQYDYWTGAPEFVGAATSKNTLGAVCLVSGLFLFWDTLGRWRERRKRQTKRILVVNVALFAMTLWILNLSNSATSRVCLALGCAVIATAHIGSWRGRYRLLKVAVPASYCLYLLLSLGFNVTGQLAGAVGRDPTLTDRTKIWAVLLKMHTNPLLGTGYESFWLGPRLEWIWAQGLGEINEAHNGALEVYLNLGALGVLLLAAFMIFSYRSSIKRLGSDSGLSLFALAIWATFLFHSVTEADFRSGVLWLTFLLASVGVQVQPRLRSSGLPRGKVTEPDHPVFAEPASGYSRGPN